MERLKELRESKHLLQKEIANALSIDRTTYVKYEKGTSEPNIEMLKRLSSFFSVSIDYLVDNPLSFVKPSLTDDAQLLLTLYMNLNTIGKTALLSAAESFSNKPQFRITNEEEKISSVS